MSEKEINESSTDEKKPEIAITPADSTVDESLDIILKGLKPNQEVTITSEFVDKGQKWRGKAAFKADGRGIIDLDKDAPIEGDYSDKNPMGLVQFATPVDDTTGESRDKYELHLTAGIDSTKVAETTATRRIKGQNVKRVRAKSDKDGIVGNLYLPEENGTHPGVVLFHGSSGEPMTREAKILASQGFAALALRYFGEDETLPDVLAEIPVSYFEKAVGWLASHERVEDTEIGVIGVSRGSEAAILTGAHIDKVEKIIAYAPSAYVWPGEGQGIEKPSPWNVNGEALPVIPNPGGEPPIEETERGTKVRPMFEACVEHATENELENARLPLDKLEGKLLLITGCDDGVWNSEKMAEVIAQNISDSAEVTHLSFENCGHQMGFPYQPTTNRSVKEGLEGMDGKMVHGGTPEGIAEMEEKSWDAVLDTLKTVNAKVDDLSIEAPETSQNDESIGIRITGAPPGEKVEFNASFVDDDGVEWYSNAEFVADSDGIVDLSQHAPESGSYEGVEDMGWLWSMTTDSEEWFPTLESSEIDVELEAKIREKKATSTITRVLYDDEIIEEEVDNDRLVGSLYLPPREGPHPGVIDLHGSSGRLSDRRAHLLASHGYAVLALEYFGDSEGIPDEHREIALSYFDEAADWMQQHPLVTDGSLGLLGVSRGAELALILGARRDWVGAVVSYAGTGVAWNTPHRVPAWIDDRVDDGEPVPHLKGKDTPNETVEKGLEDEPVEEASMEVEETNGPILLISGGDDEVWPSRRLSDISVRRLERHDFEHEFDHLTYDLVGHYIGTPYLPLKGVDMDYEKVRATAHAGEDSWPVVLEYLEKASKTKEVEND